MKRDTYLKLKKQKRRAKLLGIITLLSIVGVNIKNKKDKTEEMPTSIIEVKDIEILDKNGIPYPTKDNNFLKNEHDAFANMSIQLYNSYTNDRKGIEIIPEYQWLDVKYTNDYFSYVVTENGKTGYVPNSVITFLPDNYVVTDLSEQLTKVIYNNEVVLEFENVTGKPGHETNIGYTEIWAKNYNRYLTGPGYSRYVKYAFFFNDYEEAYHDASWRSEFGGDIYMTNGSLGCINSREEDIERMDTFVEVGTKVLVHR